MSAAHTPCFEDMDALTRIHGEFTDRVNDMAMAMQDESYTVGRQRGLADGKAQRDELLAAVQVCLDAERERAKKLLHGAPATTYTQKRIDMLEAAITRATEPR